MIDHATKHLTCLVVAARVCATVQVADPPSSEDVERTIRSLLVPSP